MNTQNVMNSQVRTYSGFRPAPQGQVSIQSHTSNAFGIDTTDSFVPSQFAMQQKDDLAFSARSQCNSGPQATLQAAEDFLWGARAQALGGGASSGSSQFSAQAQTDMMFEAQARALRGGSTGSPQFNAQAQTDMMFQAQARALREGATF